MNGLIPSGYVENKCVDSGRVRALTVTEQLKERKEYHESQLANINAAIEALEKNPEFTNCLELVQKSFN